MDNKKKTVNYCHNCLRYNPEESICLYHTIKVDSTGVCLQYLENFEKEYIN